MTRWLACLGLCCGLWVAMTAGSAPGQRPHDAASTVKTTAAKEPHRSSPSRELRKPSDRLTDDCQQPERPDDGNNPSDPRRNGDKPRSGGRHRGVPAHEWRFIYNAVRRAGGPLELLPLLFIPEVRQELQLSEHDIKPKLEAYMDQMRKRTDEHRQQIAGQPKSELVKLFNQHVEKENVRFQAFLDQLTESQKDQLIYRFIQARNYRALSNQLVQAKMGMNESDRSKIRDEIDVIREQTMDETRDRFRRIFEKGGGGDEFEKLVRENQRKMDARIEKKLSEAQREKFAELRNKTEVEPPEWLIRGLEFPFGPPPSKRPPPRGQPTAQDASPAKSQPD